MSFIASGNGNELMESAIYAEFAQSLSQITYMVEDLEGRSLLDGLLSEKII